MVNNEECRTSRMKHDLKSKSGTIIVQFVVAIITVVLMAMLAKHMAGSNTHELLGIAGIVTASIFFDIITTQTRFND